MVKIHVFQTVLKKWSGFRKNTFIFPLSRGGGSRPKSEKFPFLNLSLSGWEPVFFTLPSMSDLHSRQLLRLIHY